MFRRSAGESAVFREHPAAASRRAEREDETTASQRGGAEPEVTMTKTLNRPPFDPELEAVLVMLADQLPSTFTPEMIPLMRSVAVTPPLEELLAGHEVSHREVTIARSAISDPVPLAIQPSNQ